MKKLIAAILGVFFSLNALFSAAVVDTTITETDFDSALADSIWYSQFQAGGPNNTHPDNEFEHGQNPSTPFFLGNTSVNDGGVDNPLIVQINGSNFLSTTFNGVTTPGPSGEDQGSEYGIIDPYNVIWVGLKSSGAVHPSDEFSVTNQVVDSEINLPDLQITGQAKFSGFKFYLDDELTNIADIGIVADLIIGENNLFSAVDEDLTLTYFGTFDESIVPEPSNYSVIIALMCLVTAALRRNR